MMYMTFVDNVRIFTNEMYDVRIFLMTCKSMAYVDRVCATEVHNRLTVHNVEGLLVECVYFNV